MLRKLAKLRQKIDADDGPRDPIKSVAILHLDIVGSTQLVRDNMLLAHRQTQHLYTRICRICRLHHGTVREIRGDAAVVEFESANAALSATIAIHSANAMLDNTRMGRINPEIRTGLSYGPVISDEHMITGEAVIRAQRIEQLAQPGKVMFDQSMLDRLGQYRDFKVQQHGTRTLKGFHERVMIYEAINTSSAPLRGLTNHFRSLACQTNACGECGC